MAVNFLYSSGKAAEKKRKIMTQVKTVATVVLAVIVIAGAAMLGAGVYVNRENSRLAGEEKSLQAEVVKQAQAEARVWQIDDRARVVMAEAKGGRKMAAEMQKVTPADDIRIAGWSLGGGKGSLEVEAVYPETLEDYGKKLRIVYPQAMVLNVSWSSSGSWMMGMDLGGGK